MHALMSEKSFFPHTYIEAGGLGREKSANNGLQGRHIFQHIYRNVGYVATRDEKFVYMGKGAAPAILLASTAIYVPRTTLYFF